MKYAPKWKTILKLEAPQALLYIKIKVHTFPGDIQQVTEKIEL